MNKTISINIAGFVFNIEEQAYEKLSRYLESIKSNFKNESDCQEIMDDIEARIAELFQENLSEQKEVIVDTDVEGVISVMGNPEDYISEETADNFNEQQEASPNDNKPSNRPRPVRHKRMYRDEKGGSIGGVSTGLGWYFGIDPVLLKIAFVLMTLLGGSGILIYIILWIVIPDAKSTAEILEMQGEPVTLGSIKDHVKTVKDDLKGGARQGKTKVKSVVNKGVTAGSKLATTFLKIMGGFFIIGGIAALFVLSIILFGDTGLLPIVGTEQIEDLPTMLQLVYPAGRGNLVFISILLAALIPILAGIFLGTKLLFDIKGKFKKVSLAASIIWFLAVGSLVITGIELGMNFRNEAEIDYEVPVEIDSLNTLFVDVQEDDIFSNFIEYNQVWNYSELISVRDDKVYLGYPELNILEKADSGNFEVILYKSSHAHYNKEAIYKAEGIQYTMNSTPNRLELAPYFVIEQKDKMRGQHLMIEIHVPIGKKVKFGPNIDRILVGISDDEFRHNESFANTIWTVDDAGFRCIKCKNKRVYDDDLIDFDS
jgi:phage shock protein PspC (stress-responsive transcriptional regulator)